MTLTRLRRLRHHPKVRDLIRQTQLTVNDLVQPLFIKAGLNEKTAIASMPGQFQLRLADLPVECERIHNLGIPAVLLFGVPAVKDEHGSEAYTEEGIIQQAVKIIKQHTPELLVITDCCFCEYTSHGHCGIMADRNGIIDLDNDATLALLAKQALIQAQAGADVIAPSGMLDGMVKTIRQSLDQHDYKHIPILSYAAKYASAGYTPFRDAAEGAPDFGDRKSYQMDPANSFEALREVALDIDEGADIIMVKPALAYLDIIYKIKQTYPQIPLCAYQVSGEYSLIKAASQQGWIEERDVILEQLISIKRAGADFIISYFAQDVARWLAE